MQLLDESRGELTCPRCEERQPLSDFAVLGLNARYAGMLSRVYRCRMCSHLFAPRLTSAAVRQPASLVALPAGRPESPASLPPLERLAS